MVNCNDLTTIGGRIKQYRENLNMTQSDLAKKMHIKRELVSMWETGGRDVKTANIIMLAKIFNISCDELLTGVKAEQVDISRSTGLSSKAIEKLISFNNLEFENTDPYHTDEYNLIDVINYLLEHEYFSVFVKHLSQIFRLYKSDPVNMNTVIDADNYKEAEKLIFEFFDKFKVKLVASSDYYQLMIETCKYDLDHIMRDLIEQ